MILRLSPALVDQFAEHGQQAYPQEAAGLLLGVMDGQDRVVEHMLPMPNTFDEAERGRRYQIDPRQMIEAEARAEALGLEIIGVFHTHPDHPPVPSAFDLERALPWLVYLITSIEDGRAVEHRAWRLDEARRAFDEIQLSGLPALEDL
jgi:proteasome lid subunit RPN8/RPN11